MESSMLVSVVIPTFNRAELIGRAVKSVQAQIFSDLEIIVVDDASKDNTRDIVKALQQADERIVYLCHASNQGAQAARNTGIKAAKGEYIAFLDSDNEWLDEKLQSQMVLFSQKADSPGAVYCGYDIVSPNGNILTTFRPLHCGLVYKQTLNEWLTDTSTLVVQKDILEKIHGFDENIRSYQEWDLCIRLARECEFNFVPDSLSIYHEHNLPSISKDRLRDAYGYLSVVDKYREDILRECGSRTLSAHLLNVGRLFILADRFDLTRTYFLKSVRYYPLNIKAWMNFGVSLLGKDVYKFLRRQKHGRLIRNYSARR
jgi:glycosyltransferase involved in cell wall biosynthesis